MAETIFDKIIQGKIPCYKIYEDKNTLAFLDIHPHAKGHTLVIPKKSGETVFDLDDATLQSLMLAVKKTMKLLQEKLQPEGFNIGWNHKTAGGQAVPHVHVHIMPRWKNDGGGSMHSIIKNPGTMSVEELVKLFPKI